MAIRKILPFLRKGYVYSHAVFLANIPTMIGEGVYKTHAEEIENAVKDIIASLKEKNNVIALTNRCIEAILKDESHDFHAEEWDKAIFDLQVADLFGKRQWVDKPLSEQSQIRNEVISKVEDTLKIVTTRNFNDYKYKALRTDDLIMEYLSNQGFEIKKNTRLYHPSDTEYTFERPFDEADGKTYLGSPRTPSVKNPVAMRALYQLRKLMNYLIKTGAIDSETRINVELANEVNDKNWRKAILEFEKDKEKKNLEYEKRIIQLCKECGFDIIPTNDDIKKFRLWKEQNGYIDPAVKDIRIVKRHKAQLELAYYKGKLHRFIAKDVTSGFKNSQLNDTRIITKFALNYLRSVFHHTYPVKGAMTDIFKRQWGVLEEEKKDRSNYRHHVVDALTIACIDRTKFNMLSQAIRASADGVHMKFAKPWETFNKDVLAAVQYIVPKHFVDDNSLRQTKKVLRDRYGKSCLDKNGNKIYIRGNTARGSLHKDTFYGCIQTPPEKGKEPEKIFVQRVTCDTLTQVSADKIIDKGIRNTFLQNIESGKQTLAEIQAKGILLPYQMNGNDVYVKRVRIKAKPTAPLILKQHHNVVNKNYKEYKQNYYVVNDENYLIALYRGKDEKGKDTGDYIVSNLLDAVHNKQAGKELYPKELNKKGQKLILYKVLKIGKTVILKQDENENVFALSTEDLWKRIYSVIGIQTNSQIKLTHCIVSSVWKVRPGVPITQYSDYRLISANQLNFLLEDMDFTISPAGEIVQK